ncbi:branched-chain amino acid ABC transporter substrate-binding protein [Acrocarpospora pleiomorpha]|uniref:Branched-chain amino acid ABC transporter substrate-binding protein n=1 Tax=Acrocarpospora pleiomorpha TaxID=90975 RepID=A0A5M3XKT4_9ACTN|nr:ABC transporter substrate-binding protein [Acrocarpospora pleiomorpha]GES21560.1 branched-chain amino acid ABC transporter substrate-binding protein [Acrocarpospora pleiomorpha]
MRPTGKKFAVVTAAALAAALSLTACGGRGSNDSSAIPGVTDSEIILGSSYPYSGPASAFGTIGKGIATYFDYLNAEKGGVKMGDGKTRKIKFISYDDSYAPEKQLANAQKLVEQDKVFATFAMFGTPTHLAAVDYLNAKKVPDVWVNSVSAQFSVESTKWPFTLAFPPTGQTEVDVLATYLGQTKPDAKIGLLFQNDDTGKGAVAQLEKNVAGTRMKLVAKESYEVTDPTVDSQVTNLVQSGADVIWMAVAPKQGAQAIKRSAELKFKGVRIISTTASSVAAVLTPAGLEASKGLISTAFTKDASDPKWASDPDVVEANRIIEKYGKGLKANDSLALTGINAAQIMERTLERMDEPTRDSLMKTVRTIDPPLQLPLVLPGVTVSTGPDKLLAVTILQVQQFDGAAWQSVGEPVSLDQ